MNTPICDFVKKYIESGTVRLHMPGHKGVPLLGVEHLDITEVRGADSLYEAEGIIMESEKNASMLFGCPTYYATEGSSQCIRAMVLLAAQAAQSQGKPLKIAAGRNAHRTFLSAAALMDAQVVWLHGEETESYLSCTLTAKSVEAVLCREQPAAVYLTSPDYLGNMAPVREIANLCRKHGALLLVDNAHGAYLKFLPESLHPMELGADLCCDSAHKTLPALTGAAYLHTEAGFDPHAVRNALAMFGTTSPSYLILQSLDAVCGVLGENYGAKLAAFCAQIADLKKKLAQKGYELAGHEPMKITLCPKSYGYTGEELHNFLRQKGMECEFSDPDFLVLMVSPESGEALETVGRVLLEVPQKTAILQAPPKRRAAERVMSIRQAALSPCETLPTEKALGRILAAASVGCPPAVPIAVCGERLDENALQCFKYYGITECSVVKE